MSDSEISITLPDGSSKTLPAGSSAAELAASIGPGLAKAAVAARVDGVLTDLAAPLPNGAEVEWGRPAARALDEPSPEMKMDGLEEALRLYPGLSGVRRVRLQYREQTVEPKRVARGNGTADGPSR